MKLVPSTGSEIDDPSDAQIRESLAALGVGAEEAGFAILQRDEMTYVQVAGDAAAGFDVEYQEGDIEHHFGADRGKFSLDEVVEVFGAYRDGTIDWSRYGTWSRITW